MVIQNNTSLITAKYPYGDVRRKTVNGRRHYEGEGKFLPSVTTILSQTKTKADLAGLERWKQRVGTEQAEAIKNQAASVGTAMHKFLECHIQGVGYDDQTNIGVWRGQPAIIDFKQTNKPKIEKYVQDYFMQLAAYAMAHDALYGTKLEAGVILMASRGMNLQIFTINGDRFDDYKYQWLKRCEKYFNLGE